jgi:protein gp37
MFLTKNPARYALMVELYPALKDRNIWLGTTLDKGYSSNAPTNEERLDAINNLDYPRKWVSMEPLAPKLIDWYKEQIHGLDIQWLVVGFRTNPGPVLARRDLANLQFLLDIPIKQNIPVFVKASVFEQDHKLRNFQYTWPREFPDGVQLATKPAAWSPKERVVKT